MNELMWSRHLREAGDDVGATHLSAEQTRIANEIRRIDEELDENADRARRVAIAGIRSGGSIPASGGVLRGRSTIDHERDELLQRRAGLAARLKASVEASEPSPDRGPGSTEPSKDPRRPVG